MCGGARTFACHARVKVRWRINEGRYRGDGGWKAFAHGISSPLGEGEGYFWKALAHDVPPRTNIIYTPKTDWYLRVLACPSHELAVYTENSLENFVRISCSRKKVVPLFRKSYHFFAYQLFPSPYQLFPLLYQLFPSQGTPSPRTGAASFLCLRNLGI